MSQCGRKVSGQEKVVHVAPRHAIKVLKGLRSTELTTQPPGKRQSSVRYVGITILLSLPSMLAGVHRKEQTGRTLDRVLRMGAIAAASALAELYST